MIKEFAYFNDDTFDARAEKKIKKREDFLNRTLQTFFDYVAELVRQPKNSIDFSGITPDLKEMALDEFLEKQHPGLLEKERVQLREDLLQMF